MLLGGVSWSVSGNLGNLQITFTIPFDDINQYMVVARSTDELKKALLLGFYNRTQDINIIYKGTITQSDINSAKEAIFRYDTYLNACINSCDVTMVSNKKFGINAISFNCSYATTKEQEDYIDSTVDFIVSKLTNIDMSEDEKEKLIHDYIVTNIEYSEDDKYGDAYSALYYGKTKCDGYAMLTYKMLRAAGIENIIVTNEDHAWNVVKINDKWYHLDTTWDDAKKKDYGFYRYYNLTDDEILETRNYNNVYGKECISNYIDDLSERNTENSGKYGEILKDIRQDDDYYFINSFKSNASLDLLYNEVVLKEGESISLVDDIIPIELYENSYQWSTSDTDVATVTNGIITAKKAGTIMISAQPMYDMLSTASLFCKVHVMPVEAEDGKTPQVLDQGDISGFTDSSVQLQLKINSQNNINNTTTVTNATDLLSGKIGFIGEPVNVTTTSEFNWAEIGFKLGEEHLANVDINDLVIYWYDEETGTIVPQATMVDEINGVISATVTHFSTFFVASKQVSNLTIAFVIDSKYSSQASLDTFKTNIYNTIVELRKESNLRAIFIDAKTNEKILNFYVPAAGVYTGSEFNTMDYVNNAFKKMTHGGLIPSDQEILGTVNGGMTSGYEEIDSINMSGFKNNKYVLVYTRWDAFFVDNNSIINKMGDTIGLVIGNTIGYYAGGPISYKQADIIPLVEFLKEGNYTQITLSNTNKTPWVLKQDGNNIENDVIVLQKILVELGLLEMPTDTLFGNYLGLTKTAVMNFQKNNGLGQDGKVGKITWNKLALPWDEENAQPDRSSWSYKFILQNDNFYTASPQVTLSAPTATTEVGESIKIAAQGTNCHHLAVFINGEWKKTVYGDSNTNTINLQYDFKVPAIGKYNIQVKGRNIPGDSGGELVSSGIVTIDVVSSKYDKYFENELTITTLKNGYAFYEELWWQDLHKIKALLPMLREQVEEKGDILLPTMKAKNISDMRIMMIIQKALWTTKVTGDWYCGSNPTIDAIENIFTRYGVKDVSQYYLSEELIDVLEKRVDENIAYYDKHPDFKRLSDSLERSGFGDLLYSSVIYGIIGFAEINKNFRIEGDYKLVEAASDVLDEAAPILKEATEAELKIGQRVIEKELAEIGAAETQQEIKVIKNGIKETIKGINSAGAEEVESIMARASQIKLEYNITNPNFGVAKVSTNLYSGEVKAYSGFNNVVSNPNNTVINNNFAKEVTDGAFKDVILKANRAQIVNGDKAWLRSVDSECKILEDVAAKLGNNYKATGTIDLFTDLPCCQSCTDVIMQFRNMYQNIKLNVFCGIPLS